MILPRITRSLVGQRALSTRCLHLHAFRIVSTQVFSLPGAAKTVTGSCFQQTRRESTDVQIPHWIQPGDWVCGNCHGHNFRSRTLCFTCQDPNLKGRTFYRKGDWCCPKCEIQVPGKSDHCTKCLTQKEAEYEYPLSNRDFEMPKEADKSPFSPHTKRGDWRCSCGTLNKGGFKGHSVSCGECGAPRKISDGEKLSGDWQCECAQVNFGGRKECLACGAPKVSADQ